MNENHQDYFFACLEKYVKGLYADGTVERWEEQHKIAVVEKARRKLNRKIKEEKAVLDCLEAIEDNIMAENGTRAKTADELNIILARLFDKLESPDVTAFDLRLAETVSNLIGKQMKVEGIRIAYESLSMKNRANYKFLGCNPRKK